MTTFITYFYFRKMINNTLKRCFDDNFTYKKTPNQTKALEKLEAFLQSPLINEAFLLKGYAGTGKTSLVGALVKSLAQLNKKTLLLAPTGRAAKVFSLYAQQKAYTIHRIIYRQRKYGEEELGFERGKNLRKDTLFVVDEASMISDVSMSGTAFGSGRLLYDLIHYVYTGVNCRLILMGDVAQLPPVGLTSSPALDPIVLEGYRLHVTEETLMQIVRQQQDSGILFNATHLREALRSGEVEIYPKLKIEGFEDFRQVSGLDMLEELSTAYSRDGKEETMVITRSNKRANAFNKGIRNQIFYAEEELNGGDWLMVTKNNYHWMEGNKQMDFIANGEIVQVKCVRNTQELYGCRFADVTVAFPDYETEVDLKVLLDTLSADSPSLPRSENERLFHAIMDDYEEIPTQGQRMKALKADAFYNALQIKFAYAITCHKAQGGQWMNVFIDIGYMTEEMLGEDFYRWLYTAITRATSRIYMVNLPKEFREE